MIIRGYYFITDAELSQAGNLSDVENAVAAGVAVVQYRRKNAATRDLYQEAIRLRQACPPPAIFLINDRVDIALASRADGVHLGQGDLPCAAARRLLGNRATIGVTVHSVADAVRAVAEGADYLGVSPIFATSTKKDAGPPAGLTVLSDIRRIVSLPLVAIGGITLATAGEVIKAGADALCAISAVVASPDVRLEAAKFQALFKPVQGRSRA